ncbi:hypothetical protein RSAG8_12194, partial [Rhizoctonia solani AG-8 WAC10335]
MSAPHYTAVDPTLINNSPSDQTSIITTLQEIRDICILLNQNVEYLHNIVGINTTDIGAAGTNHTTLENSVSNIEVILNQAIADILRLGTGGAGGSSGTTVPKKVKLKEPTKFDRTDKNKAVSFRVAITHYLQVTHPGVSADDHIAFIISCLDGKAHEWLDPYLEQDVVHSTPVAWLHDVNMFWTEFNARWNVQNKKESNRGKLQNLVQTKTFQEYHKDFQTYSQGLSYNDDALRDMLYDGITVEIKKMMVAQNFDHSTVTCNTLAAKALEIESRLEAFNLQNKSHTTGKSTSKGDSKSSTATLGAPGNKLSVGDDVYVIRDGKAVKGKITKVGKNNKGKEAPTVQWNDGTTSFAKFKSLKLDNFPSEPSSSYTPPAPSKASTSSSGPTPMDLDAAGSSKKPLICHNCGGKGHIIAQCPSKKGLSGAGAEESSDSENEDL